MKEISAKKLRYKIATYLKSYIISCIDFIIFIFKIKLIMQENMQYACRKTLADSRPRVRGRFAKNDDFGETHRPTCSNHEDDDEVRFHSYIHFYDLIHIKCQC